MSSDSPSQAREQSVAVGLLVALVASLREWSSGSLLVRSGRSLRSAVATATTDSALTRSGRVAHSWLRGSFLYRWLTAKPDPQVVVVDLRESVTVGPLVRMLDWVHSRLAASSTHSRTYRAGIETVAEFRRAPLRVAGFVLCVAALSALSLDVLTGGFSVSALVVSGLGFLVGLVGTQIRVPLTQLADARTVQMLLAAFEPPGQDGHADQTGRSGPLAGRDE